jgi:hypothetical protein
MTTLTRVVRNKLLTAAVTSKRASFYYNHHHCSSISSSTTSSTTKTTPSDVVSGAVPDVAADEEEEEDLVSYSNTVAFSALNPAMPTLLQPRVVVFDGVCHLCHRGYLSRVSLFIYLFLVWIAYLFILFFKNKLVGGQGRKKK